MNIQQRESFQVTDSTLACIVTWMCSHCHTNLYFKVLQIGPRRFHQSLSDVGCQDILSSKKPMWKVCQWTYTMVCTLFRLQVHCSIHLWYGTLPIARLETSFSLLHDTMWAYRKSCHCWIMHAGHDIINWSILCMRKCTHKISRSCLAEEQIPLFIDTWELLPNESHRSSDSRETFCRGGSDL